MLFVMMMPLMSELLRNILKLRNGKSNIENKPRSGCRADFGNESFSYRCKTKITTDQIAGSLLISWNHIVTHRNKDAQAWLRLFSVKPPYSIWHLYLATAISTSNNFRSYQVRILSVRSPDISIS